MNKWKALFNGWTPTYHGYGIYSLAKDDVKVYINVDAHEVIAAGHEPLLYLESLPKKDYKELRHYVRKFAKDDLPLCDTCNEKPIKDYRESCKECYQKEVDALLDELTTKK